MNKQKQRESSRKWKAKNKEKIKEYDMKYYQKNKEQKKDKRKKYYQEHKEKEKEHQKERYKKIKDNPKYKLKKREIQKNYVKRNPEKIKARNMASRKLKHLKKPGYEFHHIDYNKPLFSRGFIY